jgi:hypothetical protein
LVVDDVERDQKSLFLFDNPPAGWLESQQYDPAYTPPPSSSPRGERVGWAIRKLKFSAIIGFQARRQKSAGFLFALSLRQLNGN